SLNLLRGYLVGLQLCLAQEFGSESRVDDAMAQQIKQPNGWIDRKTLRPHQGPYQRVRDACVKCVPLNQDSNPRDDALRSRHFHSPIVERVIENATDGT